MAMVGLTGRKLAWCNVGDASIQLFRRAPGEGRLRCVFSTVEQRSTVRTASGQEIQMPLQLGCYSHADQTVEHAVKSMEGAYFGIMTPEWEGFVLFCCCFVSRWATYLLCDGSSPAGTSGGKSGRAGVAYHHCDCYCCYYYH